MVTKEKKKKKGKLTMGMAASQARFLGLTARKNNVEYEGQQVNQQRTTLANQSANYYNQLLGMSVPKPPSTSDFTKTVYTFEDGNLSNQITSLIAQVGGTYLVSYNRTWVNDHTPVVAGSAIVTESEDDKYFVGGTELRQLFPDNPWTEEEINADPYLKQLSDDERTALLNEEEQLKKLLNAKYGDDNTVWFVRYVQNTTDNTWNPVFYNKKVVEEAMYDNNGVSQSNIPSYKMGSAKEVDEVKGVTAMLEKDATGRYTSITIKGENNTPDVTYALITNTITDEAAYDDAMNQYEYDKHQYDQAITEINAKIEIVQAQDKNLELRLKQLDTEQEAISQEMDAVKNVIEKNVETTFKTFG